MQHQEWEYEVSIVTTAQEGDVYALKSLLGYHGDWELVSAVPFTWTEDPFQRGPGLLVTNMLLIFKRPRR